MEPRTKITYNGNTYPFYKTNRGNVDYENAGFTVADALEGKTTALLAMVYYNLRDCAKRAGTPIQDSFEQFIDNSDPNITDVFFELYRLREDGKSTAPEELKEASDPGQ